MKTIRKKLHTIKYKAPDYGFSALANEWIQAVADIRCLVFLAI